MVEFQSSQDLLPLLLVSEAGQRLSGEIRNVNQRTGFIAYSPALSLNSGAYKLSYQIVVQKEHEPQDGNNHPYVVLLVKQGFYILAVNTINSVTDRSEEKGIVFSVVPPSDQPATVEFLLQVVTPADVRLRALAIEPAGVAVPSPGLAAFEIEDWLPFMQKQPGVQIDLDGFLVDEGKIGFICWGPYWTLPAGRYEAIAVIVPHVSNSEGAPLVTLDVSSDSGRHLITQHEWHLGQILPEDLQKAYECRLPFELSDDLSAYLRTIETRMSTSGGGSFRLRSLRVRPLSTEPEGDVFRYLTVRECGVHIGDAINSLENRTGCIACTPPLYVKAGRYEAHLSLVDRRTERSNNAGGEIALEIQSGLDILASETYKLEPGRDINTILPFDVTGDLAATGYVQLKIQTTSPAVVSVRALHIPKVSDDVPMRLQSFQGSALWADRFRLGTVGRATPRGVLARAGLAGLVGYMLVPYRAGHYEIVLKVGRVGHRGYSHGKLTVSAGNVILTSQTFDLHSWSLVPRGPFRFCAFEAPADLARMAAVIQIRVDNTGFAPFLVKSIALTPRARFGNTRDWAFLAVRQTLKRLRALVSSK